MDAKDVSELAGVATALKKIRGALQRGAVAQADLIRLLAANASVVSAAEELDQAIEDAIYMRQANLSEAVC